MTALPWTPANHGPLTAVTDGLWTVDATLALLPIGRRMVIARLSTPMQIDSLLSVGMLK